MFWTIYLYITHWTIGVSLVVIKAAIRWPNCQINYKSGVSQRVFLRSIDIKTYKDEITTIEWSGGCNAHPVYLGLDDIESIYWLY